jgi:hypothetical protein
VDVIAAEHEGTNGPRGGRAVTILIPVTGHTFEAELEASAQGSLWIHEFRAATGERIVSWELVAVLKLGWRIANASPEEQAVLETHGFWSGRTL